MNTTMADIPVNDIAPLVEVADYSIYLFVALIIVTAAIIFGILFYALKKWRNRHISERHISYKLLETIDFSNPKHAAYTISRIGYRFAADNERTQSAYHHLFERLKPYKYALNVEPIDTETIAYFRLYLEMIDV
ncbi:MAG: hypothetical protein PHO27_03595 [Sulfuricurvum sp.]|nr:hypothetical protein [Sulfuricurvum sp.]